MKTNKLHPHTTVGAVTLNVANLEKQTAFYHEVIGLQILTRRQDQTELGSAAGKLLTLRHLPEGQPNKLAAPGLYHLALRLPTRADLGHWLRHYERIGAPHWQGASDHGVSEALYLSDPEGNGIEIEWDKPTTQWPRRPDGSIEMYSIALNLADLMASAPPAPWTGLPPATDMGHIHLKVSDLAAARHFYVELLGFDIVSAFDTALFISVNNYHHHLGLNTWHSRGAPARPAEAYGLQQATLIFPDATERVAVIERLQANGWPVDTNPTTPTVADPAGNRLALETTV